MADVFISYSRRDGAFVHELHDFLTESGRDVWVDWEDIAPASQWERDIGESIDGAESFVFVVSASSLASQYCTMELARAQADGKRVVPIACEPVEPATAPQALRQLNWIWCRETDDRDAALAKLTAALDTDLEWAREHTRLLVRAVEWDERHDPSLLLRGRELEEAGQALALNAGKEPATTELMQTYVLESRGATSRRQRIVLGSVTLALVVSVALGVLALLQRNEANDRARVSRSQALAAQASEALATAPATALRDAVQAVEEGSTPESRLALRRALLANPIHYVIPAGPGTRDDVTPALAFSADGSLLLGLRPDGVLRLWRSSDGKPVTAKATAKAAALAPGRLLTADRKALRLVAVHGGTQRRRAPAGQVVAGVGFAGTRPLALVAGRGRAAVLDVATGRTVALRAPHAGAEEAVFSAHGSRVVTIQPYVAARVWDTANGRLVLAVKGASTAAISPDGRLVATSGEGPTQLRSVDTGTRLALLGDETSTMLFSPDGSLLVAVTGDGAAKVWHARTGRLLATLPGSGTSHPAGKGSFSTRFSPGAAFTADGRLLALADADGIVRVWELATRKQVGAAGMGYANTLAFAPRGALLAAMTWDGDVVVARTPASVGIVTGYSPSTCFEDFPPTLDTAGTRVLAPAAGGAGIWRVDGRPVQHLPTLAGRPGTGSVAGAAFSGDGKVVAAAAAGSGCSAVFGERYATGVWRTGAAAPFARLPQIQDTTVLLDRRGTLLAADGRAWRTATEARVPALNGIVALSPDGRLAALRRRGELAVVRIGTGETVSVLQGFGRFAPYDVTAAFSPDGRRLVTRRLEELRLWDVASGRSLARLGRHGQSVLSFRFGAGGRRVLVAFATRATIFDGTDGRPLLSAPGVFDAISGDGTLGARARLDGAVDVVDLATGLTAAVQTDTAVPLVGVSFGPHASLLVAGDEDGNVHVVRCEVCAPDAALLARARTRLELVSAFKPAVPPVGAVG